MRNNKKLQETTEGSISVFHPLASIYFCSFKFVNIRFIIIQIKVIL
jgi:hypothetical protein